MKEKKQTILDIKSGFDGKILSIFYEISRNITGFNKYPYKNV